MVSVNEKRQKAMDDHVTPILNLAGDSDAVLQAVVSQMLREQNLDYSPQAVMAWVRDTTQQLDKDEILGSSNRAEQMIINQRPSRVNLGGEAVPGPQGAHAAPVSLEPAKHSSPNMDRINAMVEIANSQDIWDKAKLAELHLLAAETDMPAATFREKLESIRINVDRSSAPESTGGANGAGGGYDVPAALSAWWSADYRKAPSEWEQSQHILSKSNVKLGDSSVLAIPMEAIKQLNATVLGVTGTGDVSGGVEESVFMYRADTPDPLAELLLPFLTSLPAFAGDAVLQPLTVPSPQMVAEPGSTGYAETGNISGTPTVLKPKLIVGYYALSRLQTYKFQPCLPRP